MNEGGIIGFSAALVRRSGPIWLESFGFTDTSKQQKVDENTLFSLQSTTKTVTAIAFLLAVQEGLVELDDQIYKHHPNFKMKSFYGDNEYKKITFRHLLSHNSSLPRESRIGGCFSRKIPKSFEEHINSINYCWLQNPVSSTYRYSNIGMDLVPYLLERITEKPYPKFLHDTLDKKLGITHHFDIPAIFQSKNVAIGYLNDYEAHKMDNVALGCGGAFISIKDQATFVKFLLNKGKHNGKTILKEELFEKLMETKDDSGGYGLGTTVNWRYGTKMFSHTGGGFGYASEMYWLPDHDLGLAVLNNNENASFYGSYSILTAIGEFLEESLRKMGIDNSQTTFMFSSDKIVKVPINKLQRLEGKYENNFFSFQIQEQDGILFYKIGGNQIELKPHDEFSFTTNAPYGLTFRLDERGTLIGCLLYHSYEGLLHCRYKGKIEPQKLPPINPEWKKYIGIYYKNYYYTEYMFFAVSLDKEGYLKAHGYKLLPHKKLDNVFASENGVVAIFEKDKMFFDNSECIKVTDIVDFFSNIVKNEPKHRAAMPWVFDDVSVGLEELRQKEDAKMIAELKKKLFRKN